MPVQLICPLCNKKISVASDNKTAICSFCGAPFFTDKALTCEIESLSNKSITASLTNREKQEVKASNVHTEKPVFLTLFLISTIILVLLGLMVFIFIFFTDTSLNKILEENDVLNTIFLLVTIPATAIFLIGLFVYKK